MHCGDTDVALLTPGFQPFASGKGRYDEVMLTACNLRSDIFWTCFSFCCFILIPRPAYQILVLHQHIVCSKIETLMIITLIFHHTETVKVLQLYWNLF